MLALGVLVVLLPEVWILAALTENPAPVHHYNKSSVSILSSARRTRIRIRIRILRPRFFFCPLTELWNCGTQRCYDGRPVYEQELRSYTHLDLDVDVDVGYIEMDFCYFLFFCLLSTAAPVLRSLFGLVFMFFGSV